MYYFNYNSQIKCFRTHVYVEIFLIFVCETRAQTAGTFQFHPVYNVEHAGQASKSGLSPVKTWEKSV
jgi:hypothetical protein